MDCQRVRTELGEFAAGQLPRARSAAIAEHLCACEACAAAHAEEEALSALARRAFDYTGPAYSFAQLRARMASIEPLQEVLVLLPKLQKIGATPRFAVAMVLLVCFGGFAYATRNARELYTACKQPLLAQRAFIGEKFPEIYESIYAPDEDDESGRAA